MTNRIKDELSDHDLLAVLLLLLVDSSIKVVKSLHKYLNRTGDNRNTNKMLDLNLLKNNHLEKLDKFLSSCSR
jgi:hypothetical protein